MFMDGRRTEKGRKLMTKAEMAIRATWAKILRTLITSISHFLALKIYIKEVNNQLKYTTLNLIKLQEQPNKEVLLDTLRWFK